MSKAVISDRIYMNKPANYKDIFAALTYEIENGNSNPLYASVEVIRNYKNVTPGIISIPRGRSDLIPSSYEIVDKRVLVPVRFPDPKLPLFPDQREVADKVEGDCLINALVGWGKSFTALHIAHKLGQKALIIVHTTALRDQWVENIEKLFDIKAGIIGSGQFDTIPPIVVGNVQTLVKNTDKISKMFGTIITDECHHCPSSTFSSIIDSSHAKYRIGLSGTLERKDGKHILFKDYFGSTIYKPSKSNTLDPTVRIIKSGISLQPGVAWATKINTLLYSEDYQKFIAELALQRARNGHKVLLVASRTEFLSNVASNIGEQASLIIGETKDRKDLLSQLESGEKSIICGSRQIFSEGISENILSSVILAEPIANTILLEQLVGRVMRLHPNKPDPEVIDINFSGQSERKQNNLRLGFYLSKGWKIV